jgi:hypothetical protein
MLLISSLSIKDSKIPPQNQLDIVIYFFNKRKHLFNYLFSKNMTGSENTMLAFSIINPGDTVGKVTRIPKPIPEPCFALIRVLRAGGECVYLIFD